MQKHYLQSTWHPHTTYSTHCNLAQLVNNRCQLFAAVRLANSQGATAATFHNPRKCCTLRRKCSWKEDTLECAYLASSAKQHLQHLHYSKINVLKENPKPEKSKAKKGTRWVGRLHKWCPQDTGSIPPHTAYFPSPPRTLARSKGGKNVQHVQNVGKSSPRRRNELGTKGSPTR